MPKVEFICVLGAMLPLQAVAVWQADLRDAYQETEVHFQTKPRRIFDDGRRREYEGWRTRYINATLDACSAIEGPVWIHKAELVDVLGRSYSGHTSKNGAHLAWRQNNEEAAKANSRLQAQKFRDRARVEWNDYCAAYIQKYPGTKPIGFDRWCRGPRASWLNKGLEGIQLNHAKGMVADVVGAIQERKSANASRSLQAA